MPNLLEIAGAKNGTFILNNTDNFTKKTYVIKVVSATVFASINDESGNGASDYISDIDSAVSAGSVITPLDINKPFTSVQLTSGCVVLTLV